MFRTYNVIILSNNVHKYLIVTLYLFKFTIIFLCVFNITEIPTIR